MELVRLGLLLLALMWALQIVASWIQLRYYRSVVRRTATAWNSGFLGAGSFKARLGRGAVAIVVIDDQARVCEVLSMSGLSVFARFEALDDLCGAAADFNQRVAMSPLPSSVKQALAKAFEVACRTANERQQAPLMTWS
ncbi:MAG: transcriptional regulator GutM [Trinickia sp.]|uniref:transcriptional regulator GutM n=1 Tax=Trinickia sp. TaxID=2571163 RepID=UPI003F7DCF62